MFYIGTSGFYYNHWIGKFYPEDIKKRDFFDFYVKKFNSVELNSTFYRLPNEKTILSWERRSGKDFKFSIKMWRKITHYRKLKGIEEDINLFIERVKPLGKKLGVVLIQLPPSIHKDLELLEDFLQKLPKNFRYAIEFRHKSWFSEDVENILKRYNISFCSVSMPELPDDIFVTSDFIYYRFHGKKTLYNYNYSEEELREFVDKLKLHLHKVKDTYIFFNNDFNCYAPFNADLLKELFLE